MSSINEILSNTINLSSLLKENPELFDLTKLTAAHIVILLKENPVLFKDKIKLNKLPVNDKAYIFTNLRNKKIVSGITFTDNELSKMSSSYYFKLVMCDFGKYIRKDLYEKMQKSDQAEIFLREPAWVITNFGKSVRLTREKLINLSEKNQKFIDSYISDFSKYSTCYKFWINMIKFDTKYKKIFLNYTKSCISKTEVRSVIFRHPDIIKLINKDTIENSKLTSKEWINLIGKIMETKESKFVNWKLSDEVREIFKIELTAEILSGKSTLSPRLQTSLSNFFERGT